VRDGAVPPARHRIDVVIPAYNAAATIGDTIVSLQNQTFADFRIIVVNDGSTDATGPVLDRLRATEPRLAVITQANAGIVAARNVGLAASSAEFVAVQDADDLSDPHRLERQVDYLDGHPRCVAVSGSARHIDATGAATGGVSTMPPLSAVDASWVPAREPYLMPFGLMRRAALIAVGGYRHVDYAEDTDLYWRLRRVGDLVNLPEVVGSYRYHPTSATGGASLVNTRILAANNQLAALSSERREAGTGDIAFGPERMARYREAATLAGVFEVACQGLEARERAHFKMAMAAKMLQWIEGRTLSPEWDDCAFMGRAYAERPALNAENLGELRRLYAVIGARLLRRGQIAKARALLPLAFVPQACARAMLGRC
jgi:glycosyltransferase involved in cell wall biosynthesis